MSAIKSIFRAHRDTNSPAKHRRLSTPNAPPLDAFPATDSAYPPHSASASSAVPAIDVTEPALPLQRSQSQENDATPRLRPDRQLHAPTTTTATLHFDESVSAEYIAPPAKSSIGTGILSGRRSSAMARPTSGTEPTSGKSSRRGSKANRSEDGHGRPELLNRHELMRRAIAAAKDPLLDDDTTDEEVTPIISSMPGFSSVGSGSGSGSGSGASGSAAGHDGVNANAAAGAPRRGPVPMTSSADGHSGPDFPSSATTSTPSKSSALSAIVTPSPIRAETPRSDSLDDALAVNPAYHGQRRASELGRPEQSDDFQGTPLVRSKTFQDVANNHLSAGPHIAKSASAFNLDGSGASGQKGRLEAPVSPLLKPGPLARLRKNSSETLSKSAKRSAATGPGGGIAGALAASGLTSIGFGQAAASQQAASTLRPPSASAHSDGGRSVMPTPTPGNNGGGVGGGAATAQGQGQSQGVRPFPANQDAGYQDGVYREPSTGTVVEWNGDQDGHDQPLLRPGRDRSMSSLVLYDGSVASERSSASGLGAAAGFDAASAARLAPIGATLPGLPNNQGQHEGGGGGGGGGSYSQHGDGTSLSGSGPSIETDAWSEDMGPQITGFAVASSKRNKDFHQLFPQVPEDDYLIEDYGCALSREILIHGRLYISENFIAFNANIFGWVTNLVVPFSDIVAIEKRMTAFVIPNAIQLATINSKHTFVSFLSRDTTYDLIVNIWRLAHPGLPVTAAEQSAELTDEYSEDDGGDAATTGSGKAPKSSKRTRLKCKLKGSTSTNKNGVRDDALAAEMATAARTGSPMIAPSRSPAAGAKKAPHRKTECLCDGDKEHYATVALDTTYPAVPEKIYNLLFTSGFTKDFWTDNQKLFELQISEWSPSAGNKMMLSRSVSYIKPLTGSFGPKQTKCLLTDENIHVDFDNSVITLTTTRTPDVPSGGSFSVKTRTCITWAGGGNVSRVYVTCAVEWTGRSMIKGIIEKACIDGQKQYYRDLDEAVREYLTKHTNEFKEEGDDEKAVEEIARAATPAVGAGGTKKSTSTTLSDDDNATGPKVKASNGLEKDANGQGGIVSSLMETTGDIVGMAFDVISSTFETISSLFDQEGGGGTNIKMVLLSTIVMLLVLFNIYTWRSVGPSSGPSRETTSGAGGYIFPDEYYVPPSPRYHSYPPPPTTQSEEVAKAVREVLKDFLQSNSAKGLGFDDGEEAIKTLLIQAEQKLKSLKNEVEELARLKRSLSRKEDETEAEQRDKKKKVEL